MLIRNEGLTTPAMPRDSFLALATMILQPEKYRPVLPKEERPELDPPLVNDDIPVEGMPGAGKLEEEDKEFMEAHLVVLDILRANKLPTTRKKIHVMLNKLTFGGDIVDELRVRVAPEGPSWM